MSEHNHIASVENQSNRRAFTFGILLNVIYTIVELAFGLRIDSMGLIADAAHNASDVLGLVLAGGSAYLATKSPTKNRTYGLRKSTILSSFLNAVILYIAVGAIVVESIRKFINPEPIQGGIMMIVAGVGIVINAATALLFLKDRHKDLNIKGAYLHMVADALDSFGVVIAGLLITLTGWLWLDPVVGICIAVVISISTWGLLRESFNLSMDAVPSGIDIDEVRTFLHSIDGVENIHDLHIWPMSTTEVALSTHIVVKNNDNNSRILQEICQGLSEKFNINHPTIQIETTATAMNCKRG
ncbi:MAG TPA: cation diffusion facilitator family transporter [Candidatus Kapabacteria bacterium]|nr:cation diffusion facilitator family transporter [Candidatus Kapabacteria bacterium]